MVIRCLTRQLNSPAQLASLTRQFNSPAQLTSDALYEFQSVTITAEYFH